ncbi:MAG: DNA-processing protein DprA [Aliishimia sp.]
MAGDLHPSSTHPPLPPTTEDIRFHHLRLLRSRRVGPSTYHRLLREHGCVHRALEALPDIAAKAGVPKYEMCPEGVIWAELKAGKRAGAKLLVFGHEGYPASLAEMSDAPPLLWCIGDNAILKQPAIAMVGARNASALGTRMATSLAKDLNSQGYVIVSGLARGIDAAAHHASLENGTIAVQAGGVDVIYPSENAELAARIAKKGLRLSEQPMGMQPMARHFPARNRIIAGLARACVLVEAAHKSGSLITARDALDLGRDVMAVPGHPFDARASGCNMLIRDGAVLVRRAEDVIEALGPISPQVLEKLQDGQPVTDRMADFTPFPTRIPKAADPSDLHALILGQLGPSPVPEDHLLRLLPAGSDDVAPVLTEMELHGQITRHAGGLLSRTA